MKRNLKFKSNLDAIKWLEKKIYTPTSSGLSIVDLLEYKGNSLFFTIFPNICFELTGKVLVFEDTTKTEKYYSFIKIIRRINNFFVGILARVLYSLELRKKKGKKKVLIFTYSGGWRPYLSDSGDVKIGDSHYWQLLDDFSKYDKEVEFVTVAPIDKIYNLNSVFETIKRILFQKQRHIPLEVFWSSKINKDINKYGKKLLNRWSIFDYNKDKVIHDLFNDDVVEGQVIFNYIKLFCDKYYFGVVKNIELCLKIMEREKPDAILVTNTGGPFWKSVMIAARLSGVKIINVQHTIMLEKDILFYCPKKVKGKINDVLPERYAVYDKNDLEFSERIFNRPKELMTITGAYTYDSLFKFKKSFDRKKYLLSLGLNPDKKTIFFAAKFRFPPFVAIEDSLIKELRKLGREYNIIVKPHPRGNLKDYSKWLRKNKLDAVLLDSSALAYHPILASDLIVSVPSTVIFEATILQKKCLMINMGLGGEKAFWNNDKNVIIVDKFKGLDIKIKKLLSSQSLKVRDNEKIRNMIYKKDGNAAKRILDLIKDEIK